MPQTLTGRGRVTVFPLLHLWPGQYVPVGYTTLDDFGMTAVVGQVPAAGVGEVSLVDVAARHLPGNRRRSAEQSDTEAACWILCAAWAARTVPKPASLDLLDAEWKLEHSKTIRSGESFYGHTVLRLGRFTLKDPALMARAVACVRREV